VIRYLFYSCTSGCRAITLFPISAPQIICDYGPHAFYLIVFEHWRISFAFSKHSIYLSVQREKEFAVITFLFHATIPQVKNTAATVMSATVIASNVFGVVHPARRRLKPTRAFAISIRSVPAPTSMVFMLVD
jgi:hypothetical protein